MVFSLERSSLLTRIYPVTLLLFQVRECPLDIHRVLPAGLRAQPGEGGLPRGAGADDDGRAHGKPLLLIAAGQGRVTHQS